MKTNKVAESECCETVEASVLAAAQIGYPVLVLQIIMIIIIIVILLLLLLLLLIIIMIILIILIIIITLILILILILMIIHLNTMMMFDVISYPVLVLKERKITHQKSQK